MTPHTIPIYPILSALLRRLPSFALRRLRWHYPPTRLASLIYVDFQPRCESAFVTLAQAAEVSVRLQVINMSPFPVELDRANLHFVYASVTTNLLHIDRKSIAPGEITSIYLRTGIPDGHAKQIAQQRHTSGAWLEGNIYFNCPVSPFPKISATCPMFR